MRTCEKGSPCVPSKLVERVKKKKTEERRRKRSISLFGSSE